MSWKSATSARLSSFKGEIKRNVANNSSGGQGWRDWAEQKIKRRKSPDSAIPGDERIALFPGWAARRYRKASGGGLEEAFEVEVFVSGYASSHRPPEFATRSQRAFLRLAKGFASLPKLQEPEGVPTLSPSTEKLLETVNLPPRPTEITHDYEVEAMESRFRAATDAISSSASSIAEADETALSAKSSRTSSRSSSPSLPSTQLSPDDSKFPARQDIHPPSSIRSDFRQLHTNLESRLQPFWSTAICTRTVKISVFAPSAVGGASDSQESEHGPIATQEVTTASDGSFQTHFTICWEDLCQHPSGAPIAFGDPLREHEFLISVSLPPTPLRIPPLPTSTPTSTYVPLTYSPVRLISDIDDTVKLSNILSGARTVFLNVFVKDLKDNVIPGMGEWYMGMWKRGVRFHYVSNGPFELLPVVQEFFQISHLPPGSIRLKSYNGRSLFNGLLSAPAARKRDGIVAILNSFADSRFVLVGDTGEQDLELYAVVASERPGQVLCVLVRDASNWGEGGPLDDPIGQNWRSILPVGGGGSMDLKEEGVGSKPASITESRKSSFAERAANSLKMSGLAITGGDKMATSAGTTEGLSADYFTSNGSQSLASPLTAEPGIYVDPGSRNAPNEETASWAAKSENYIKRRSSTDVSKKKAELQVRVWKARSIIPEHIPLRIFRNPEECQEVEKVFEKLHVGPGP